MVRIQEVEVNNTYKEKYGFSKPEKYVFKARKGLDEDVVREISSQKNEPEWMRQFRLRAYKAFKKRLKLTQLGDASRIGRGPMSSGQRSTIDAITPGDSASAPVAQQAPSQSWWSRMRGAPDPQPEGPRTVTEWMAQERLDP